MQALCLQKLGELDEAEAAYLEAINIEPENANVYANLGERSLCCSTDIMDDASSIRFGLIHEARHSSQQQI